MLFKNNKVNICKATVFKLVKLAVSLTTLLGQLTVFSVCPLFIALSSILLIYGLCDGEECMMELHIGIV